MSWSAAESSAEERRAMRPGELLGLSGDESGTQVTAFGPDSALRGWKIFLVILVVCTIVQTLLFSFLVATGEVNRAISLVSVGLSVIAIAAVIGIVEIHRRQEQSDRPMTSGHKAANHLLFATIMLIWLCQIHFFGSVLTPLSILVTMTALVASWLLGERASWFYFTLGTLGWISIIVLEKAGVLRFFPAYAKGHESYAVVFQDTRYVFFRVLVYLAVSAAMIQLMNHFQHNLRARNRELAELSRQLDVLATTDALTGLMNRRTAMTHLAREMARTQRKQGQLALIMADLDDFKKINDTHGHGVGDLVLQTAAATFRNHMRPYDMAARVGGEEFLFIVAGASAEDCDSLAERLRAALSGLSIPLPSGGSVRVTASLGCTVSSPACAQTIDELLRAADKALYAAKRQGKNRVVFGV